VTAVTFDYGQTLAELDFETLRMRVEERAATVSEAALGAASPNAWVEYNAAKRRGDEGVSAWSHFMTTLLEGSDLRPSRGDTVAAIVDFLWQQQPKKNLWRRPIAGMFELVRDLHARGVPLGIVFRVVADSGKLGFEKPDRRIFDHAARALETTANRLIHVGDAWEADVEGALAVGARVIWFGARPDARPLPDRVLACPSATELRSALRQWGIPA
jgi:putative hydrolase of the HAD superfamily